MNINFSGIIILQKLFRDEGCRFVLVNTETSCPFAGRSPVVTKGHFKPKFVH